MKNLLASLVIIVSFSSISQNWDINTLKKINIERNQQLDPTFKVITNSITPVTFAAPIAILGVGLLKKDKQLLQSSIDVTEALILNAIITTSMKYGINRDRPFITYPEIDEQTGAGSPSFPSGHTSNAFAVATSLSIAFPKWYVITPSFIWAGAMGYSRMHLGVHYPSDVFVGAIIGSGCSFLTYYVNKKISKKQSEKTKL
jgi:membrane-associated phospholipid phosphatase